MQTNKIDNTSFGQVNLIRVKRSAFQNPKNTTNCKSEFRNTINNVIGNKNSLLDDILLTLLGKAKKVKMSVDLNGKQGINLIDAPEQNNFHSFIVITGHEKDELINMFSLKNILKAENNKFVNNEQNTKNIYLNKIREYLSSKNISEFKLENLKELESIKSKLGL